MLSSARSAQRTTLFMRPFAEKYALDVEHLVDDGRAASRERMRQHGDDEHVDVARIEDTGLPQRAPVRQHLEKPAASLGRAFQIVALLGHAEIDVAPERAVGFACCAACGT